MSLRISFDLDDNDLKHFRLIMRDARSTVTRKTPEDIVAASEELLRTIGNDCTPGFILARLEKLKMMIRMISDVDWRLPHKDTVRVLSALAYFAEPDDLIPDQIPGLGFLDDAIMIELVVRELRHEIDAYDDFCEFRERELSQSGDSSAIKRQDKLNTRRTDLQSRMRRRRQRSGDSSELRILD
jgi:uncharacterized membrane protein YkvA (DUF1232 family)